MKNLAYRNVNVQKKQKTLNMEYLAKRIKSLDKGKLLMYYLN